MSVAFQGSFVAHEPVSYTHLKEVRAPFALDIRPHGGQAEKALGIINTGLFGNIRKGSVAIVVKEIVAIALESGGPALHGHAVILTCLAGAKVWQVIQMEIDIIGDKNIRPSIAVVIAEGSAHGPARVHVEASLFGNVGEMCIRDSGIAGQGTGFYQRVFVDQVWRAMFGMELIPAILFTGLCIVVPEAPRWLVKVKRYDEAKDVLARVGGASSAESELKEIERTISAASGSIGQLFKHGLRKALCVSLFLAIASELSGITIVFYYGPDILEKSGVSLGKALGGFASIGLVNVIFTIVAIWLMDIAGRRLLLFAGTVGAILSLTIVGILFRSGHTEGMTIVTMPVSYTHLRRFWLAEVPVFFAASVGRMSILPTPNSVIRLQDYVKKGKEWRFNQTSTRGTSERQAGPVPKSTATRA